MGQLNVNQGSIPAAFHQICRERIKELKQQILTPERSRELSQALAQSREGATWKEPCVLGQHIRGAVPHRTTGSHTQKAVVPLLLLALGTASLAHLIHCRPAPFVDACACTTGCCMMHYKGRKSEP
jgi:hypothetical protein